MRSDDIDAIVCAYADARLSPGGARLAEWTARYPEHADALIGYAVGTHVLGAHTAGALVAEDRGEYVVDDGDVAMFERAARLAAEQLGRPTPIADLMIEARRAGLTTHDLVRDLDLGVPELAKLNRRLFVWRSVPAALVRALSEALGRSVTDVAEYLRLPPTLSAQASYRSRRAPAVTTQEDFREAISSSPYMSAGGRKRWLSADTDAVHDA